MTAQKTTKLPTLSIFFPTYNEEKNIEAQVQAALVVAPKVAHVFEILVINDGSIDATKEIAQALAAKNPQLRVVSQRNKGYGGAVKRGFAESKYEWVFFTDADMQFDMQELERFVAYANKHQFVIGYRTTRAEGWKRRALANSFKIWNRVWLGFPRGIKDIDCAFKLMHQDVLKSVGNIEADGAMVTTELLLKAHRSGYKPKQLGVKHYKRKFGQPTGSNPKVIGKAVLETLRLRRQLWFGRTSFTSGVITLRNLLAIVI